LSAGVVLAPIQAAFNTMGPVQDPGSKAILNLRLFYQMTGYKHSTSVVCSEYDLEIVFWLHFAKIAWGLYTTCEV